MSKLPPVASSGDLISGLQASQSWICNKGQAYYSHLVFKELEHVIVIWVYSLVCRYFHVKLIWNGLQRIYVMIFRPWFWKWLYRCLPPTGYLRPECAKIYGHTWRHFGAISWPSEALWRHMTRGSFGVIMIPDGTALPVRQYPNVPYIRAPSSPWQNDNSKNVCYFNWVLLLSAQTVKGHLI